MVVTNDAEGFRVFLCDTVTGKIQAYVPPSAVSWGLKLNDAGTLSATLKVTATELRHLDVRNATTVLRQSLGVAYGSTILECGPIWEQEYDAAKEELLLTARGLWSLLDVRKVLPGNAPGAALTAADTSTTRPTSARIKLSNLSFGSIARELVRGAIQDLPFTRFDGLNAGYLNIVLPDSVGGSTSITYNGFDLGWVGTRLRELADTYGDIRIRPRFSGADATVVEWLLETGTEASPLLVQSGPDWAWDASVERSGVSSLGVKREATGVAARVFVPGNGSEANMLLSWATDTSLVQYGLPWTEADEASKDVESKTQLQAVADRLLADSRAPWDTWSLSVRADVAPALGSYLPGDWASVTVGPGHPMLRPDTYRVRILAVDGDHSATVKLTVAPIQGSF